MNKAIKNGKLKIISTHDLDDVLNLLHDSPNAHKKTLIDNHIVNASSQMISLVKRGRVCAACNAVTNRVILAKYKQDKYAHLHFVANWSKIVGFKFAVSMTKDHIVPKASGGNNHMSNLQLLCSECNNIKGDCHISNSKIAIIKDLFVHCQQLVYQGYNISPTSQCARFVRERDVQNTNEAIINEWVQRRIQRIEDNISGIRKEAA